MIRVLQVVTNMDRGGLESMLMNYYRHIDREKIQFDFLVHRQERAPLPRLSSLAIMALHSSSSTALTLPVLLRQAAITPRQS